MSSGFQFREQIPVLFPEANRGQPSPARLMDEEQDPGVFLRPTDSSGFGGGRQVHPRRHFRTLRVDQSRRRPGSRSRNPGLKTHLSNRHLLFDPVQAHLKFMLREDPPRVIQQPQVVELLRQDQPPLLPWKLHRQLPRFAPHQFQFATRQGHPPQGQLQFLSGQNLGPPGSVQRSGLDDFPLGRRHCRALGLPWGIRRQTPLEVHLEPMSRRSVHHRLGDPIPAPPTLGVHPNNPAIVIGAPAKFVGLRSREGQTMSVVMELTVPVLGMEDRKPKGSRGPPLPFPTADPNPDGLGIHRLQVSPGHGLQDRLRDLRPTPKGHRQFGGKGDDKFLGSPEKAFPLSQPISFQVVPLAEALEQFSGGHQLPRLQPDLMPEVKVMEFREDFPIPTQIPVEILKLPPLQVFSQVPREIP